MIRIVDDNKAERFRLQNLVFIILRVTPILDATYRGQGRSLPNGRQWEGRSDTQMAYLVREGGKPLTAYIVKIER